MLQLTCVAPVTVLFVSLDVYKVEPRHILIANSSDAIIQVLQPPPPPPPEGPDELKKPIVRYIPTGPLGLKRATLIHSSTCKTDGEVGQNTEKEQTNL